MPNIKSAKKRMKQDVIRREKNRHDKRTLRTQCRKVREAVAAGDVPTAQSELRQAAKLLDRAGARKVIHRNAAGRTKARLSAAIKAIKPPKSPV
jgi:small subunit ribosomal protein S20